MMNSVYWMTRTMTSRVGKVDQDDGSDGDEGRKEGREREGSDCPDGKWAVDHPDDF
jgi:hypothetical protein